MRMVEIGAVLVDSYHRFLPKPLPPGRSVFERASLTFNVRPSRSVPFRAAIAFRASSSLVISTNPKPLGYPVSGSAMMLTRSTAPWTSKSDRTTASVTEWFRFPTKMLFMLLGSPLCLPFKSEHRSSSHSDLRRSYYHSRADEPSIPASTFWPNVAHSIALCPGSKANGFIAEHKSFCGLQLGWELSPGDLRPGHRAGRTTFTPAHA